MLLEVGRGFAEPFEDPHRPKSSRFHASDGASVKCFMPPVGNACTIGRPLLQLNQLPPSLSPTDISPSSAKSARSTPVARKASSSCADSVGIGSLEALKVHPDENLEAWLNDAVMKYEEGMRLQLTRVTEELRFSIRQKFCDRVVAPPEVPPPCPVAFDNADDVETAQISERKRSSKYMRLDVGVKVPDLAARWNLTGRHEADEVVLRNAMCKPMAGLHDSDGGASVMITTSISSAVSEISTIMGQRKKWLLESMSTVASIVILLNALVLYIDMELSGQLIAAQMGYIDEYSYRNLDTVLYVLHHMFNAFFVFEISVRIYCQRLKFFKDVGNVFEFGVVIASSVDLYVLEGSSNIVLARCARLFKVARAARMSRLFTVCHELRVLFATVFLSMKAFVWSAAVLLLIIVASAMIIGQMLITYMVENCDSASTLCAWTFQHYGSSTKCIWTMFRITMSGGWPQWADTLIDEVSIWFGVFWFFYITVVWFAIVRILTALFIKQTMEVASADQEMQLVEKTRMKSRFANDLRKIFTKLDSDGSGMLSLDEFRALAEDTDARAILTVMEINFHEIKDIFHMLDDGDGQISFDEFLAGALRTRGPARAIDQFVLMHGVNKLTSQVQQLVNILPTSPP